MPENVRRDSNQPLVSVIIPFFNREKYLAEAVESVLAQTYPRWELLLIDDGSTDSGTGIAERFVEEHPGRIFLYSHENRSNRGASSSRNLGIKKAGGELITFLDSDDAYMPGALEAAVSAFETNSDIDVVCGTLRYWFSWQDEQKMGERDFLVDLGVETDEVYKPPSLLIHNLESRGRKPGMGCVVLKSELAKSTRLFKDDFLYVTEDQIFWTKVSLKARIYIMDTCMAKYRQHSKSSSAQLIESGKMVADWNKLLDWLEGFLEKENINDPKIWQALEGCRKENGYRHKFEPILNLYRRMLPVHVRYRIRDLIIKTRKKT